MRSPALALGLALACGCGGAPKGTKSPQAGGAKPRADDSIADIASREGIASLDQPPVGQGSPGGGGPLRLELADKDTPIVVDGVPKEFSLVPALTNAQGTPAGVSFRCGLAYDARDVYFAGDVTGIKLRHLRRFTPDEDYATLDFAAKAGSPVEVAVFPGKPGEMAGVVRIHGRAVPGARVVEAEKDGGYTFEAVIPWRVLAPSTVRVGLRGVAALHDGTRAVLATGDGDAASPNDMPALPTAPEEALAEMFLAPKGLLGTRPKFDLLADITGDSMKERVAVYDHFLTVVGPTYRDGKEFFYRDLGAEVTSVEARDVTGRGKRDLVLRRRFTSPYRGGQGSVTRDWLDVWAFFGDEPTPVFSHEIAVASGGKRVADAVRLGRGEIDVSYEPATGWDATSYAEPRASDTEPVLLPWGQVRSQAFRFDGKTFVKAREVAQKGTPPTTRVIATAPATATATTTRVEPPTPAQHAGGNLSAQLLARYRADRGVPAGERPRVDVQVQVDGDARPERVLLLGRDIVVFGPGFKGGTGYAYLTLSQFASPGDIEELTARDLTGDGDADLVVRGVRHVHAEGAGPIDRHEMFVYQVKNETLTRVFGIETARQEGGKRIQGLVQLVPGRGNKGFEIDVRPGVARGWTQSTYPFSQDPPGGALEPLLLPWGGIGHLRYAFDGSAFARVP